MSKSDRAIPTHPLSSTQTLQRAIWIVLGVLFLSFVLFLGYYVWDRYVHLGDQSPLDLGIAHMEEAIHQDPQNVQARVAMADFYLTAGRDAEALEQAVQVLNLEPEHASALLIAGIAHARLGDAKAALAPLQSFVAMRQDQPMAKVDEALEAAYYFLGESHIKLNQPNDAIPYLEAALAISPTDADGLYQLGLAYQAVGQPEMALERYRKAVRLVPDFAEVYGAMDGCYSALGQPGGKIYARAMNAYSLGNYEAARTDIEAAVEALPDSAPAHLGMGLIFEKLGSLDAAHTAVQRAVELDPGDLAAQQALGRIQFARIQDARDSGE